MELRRPDSLIFKSLIILLQSNQYGIETCFHPFRRKQSEKYYNRTNMELRPEVQQLQESELQELQSNQYGIETLCLAGFLI